ncbi:hypothetical protein [Desulfotignum balticum]|uniref:hypothetical protein n=1 Tax=Desulfotignum balticum TaxID=115781 RepID=UPI000423684C|nr:hypothetical protein [Desulfotignum balticum]
MNKIEVDNDVYRKLGEIAIPFKETTPNMVIRRLLELPEDRNTTSELTVKTYQSHKENLFSSLSENQSLPLQSSSIENHIEELRTKSIETHPAFLTFLMDKYNNTKGNYKTSDIVNFMEKINLKLPNGTFRNPWMKAPYGGQKNGLISCQRTIEHFKQTRKFGCWGGKDIKENCDSFNTCDYHPDSKVEMKNKCDLRNGVIWKRESPDSLFSYGHNYMKVIKKELLKNRAIPLKPFLKIVYPGCAYDTKLIEQFKKEFHFSNDELEILITI